MSTRTEERYALHEIFKTILGNNNVYFQPPSNVSMQYPAIVYELDRIDTYRADNNSWRNKYVYQVVLVDKNPDSEFVEKLIKIPSASFIQFYVADNLNHFVFTINYIGGLTL